MPKSSPHPHVSWRDGRPRFQPDQKLRAAGHKGKDLRHEDGRWFSRGEAVDWSAAFIAAGNHTRAVKADKGGPVEIVYDDAEALAVPKGRQPTVVKPAVGYIYFLWAGDRLKIGFSTTPALRAASLMTAVPDPISFLAIVKGTPSDEARLHRELAAHRSRGEWFKVSLTVIRVMQRELSKRLPALTWHAD